MTPFLSFYTPTYRRPKALAACLASVQAQTIVDRLEQIVVVDHVGIGVGGMFQRVPNHAGALTGRYVHLLADDDVLAGPDVCAAVEAAAVNDPPLILVRAKKGDLELPIGAAWPPVCGRIDLGCLITRRDIWLQHLLAYGSRYEGDFDFASALFYAGHQPLVLDLRFLTGGVMRGQPEAVQL